MVQVFSFNTDPCVFDPDGEHSSIIRNTCGNFNPATFSSKFQGVGNQVGQDVHQFLRIKIHLERFSR